MKEYFCYVGSQNQRINQFRIPNKIGKQNKNIWVTPKEEVQFYLEKIPTQYKKFLVVADSLGILLDYLGLENAYKNYFFFYDEIDRYQHDASFRPKMEEAVDYFKDPRAKGCLISATFNNLGDPYFAQLPFHIIKKENEEKKPLTITDKTSEYSDILLEILNRNPTEKVVVAYKSLSGILSIIDLLPKTIQKDTKVLCSDANINDPDLLKRYNNIKSYYGVLDKGFLQSKLTFITSTYFSGIDIYDKAHCIIITDNKNTHTALSSMEIRQIVGRFREKYHSAILINNVKRDGIKPIKYSSFLMDCKRNKDSITQYISTYSSSVKEPKYSPKVVADILSISKLKGIRLLRTNIHGEVVPRYLEFDSQSFLSHEYKDMYESDSIASYLGKYFKIEKNPLTIDTEKVRKQTWQSLLNSSLDELENITPKLRDDSLKIRLFRNILSTDDEVLLMMSKTSELKFKSKKFLLSLINLYCTSAHYYKVPLSTNRILNQMNVGNKYSTDELNEIFEDELQNWNKIDGNLKIKPFNILEANFKLKKTTKLVNASYKGAYELIAQKTLSGPYIIKNYAQDPFSVFLSRHYTHLGISII